MDIRSALRRRAAAHYVPFALAALCPALPAHAQAQAGAEPPEVPVAEEVIVTGRRDGEPDFQEQQEYHAKEYRRLKQIYDPDPPPPSRGSRLLGGTPGATGASAVVQGKPSEHY